MSDFYLGLMSGTSLDGIDAAIVDLSTQPPKVHAAQTRAYSDDVRDALLQLAQGGSDAEIELLGKLDTRLGEQFAEAALGLIDTSGLGTGAINAIGSHGQTVRHRPDGPNPFTLQIGDPNIIAERTGITTVADFRRRDVAAGGQGAPLAPAFHAACFRHTDEDRAVLNLGGIANLTVLPADPQTPITGFDTGPANVLLDAWIARHRGSRFDADGAWAASGRIIPSLLEIFMGEPFLRVGPPKSTGRELFHSGWLDDRIGDTNYAAEDVQATLAAYTARSVAVALRSWASGTRRLLVCGGGAHNGHLLSIMRGFLPGIEIESTAVYGIDPDWIEAAAFAWMARETLAGRFSSPPGVTGAHNATILGGIYLASGWQCRR
jgi:anhydro-N-acetylmuramic acid kinase